MKPFNVQPLTYFNMSWAAPCPYLPGQTEQMIFTDLSHAEEPHLLHDWLSRNGFRRSQGIAYKPNCQNCNACVPVRISLADFVMSRSLKRVTRRNRNLTVKALPARALGDHYALFRRYIRSRHGGGGMAHMGYNDFVSMVQDTPIRTQLFEFHLDDQLYGVCLTDELDDGLSLVYSFFDPDFEDMSPGIYIILWHIEEARRRGLPYVYLGYWIENSRKMAYKTRFVGAEALGDEGWQLVHSAPSGPSKPDAGQA